MQLYLLDTTALFIFIGLLLPLAQAQRGRLSEGLLRRAGTQPAIPAYRIVSRPNEQLVWAGSAALPWPQSTPYHKIPGLMDILAKNLYIRVTQDLRRDPNLQRHKPEGGLVFACLYLETSKRIYFATTPNRDVIQTLGPNFNGTLGVSTYPASLQAEHHVIANAFSDRQLRNDRTGTEHRYISIYGSDHSGNRIWDDPCRSQEDPRGRTQCRGILHRWGLEYKGNVNDQPPPSPQLGPSSPTNQVPLDIPRVASPAPIRRRSVGLQRRLFSAYNEALEDILELRRGRYLESMDTGFFDEDSEPYLNEVDMLDSPFYED